MDSVGVNSDGECTGICSVENLFRKQVGMVNQLIQF